MRALRNAAKIGNVRPVVTLRKEQTLILPDPFHRRGRVYTRNSVYVSICPSFFSFSEYFLPFRSPFFFSSTDQIFSSFSFSVFLLLCGLNIFLLKTIFHTSFSLFPYPTQAKYLPFPNTLLLFLLLGKGFSLNMCVFICTLQCLT